MNDTRAIEIEAAQRVATENGMELVVLDLAAWHFELAKDAENGWSIQLWPWRSDDGPRIEHDKEFPGPRLILRRQWSVMDAVRGAVLAESGATLPGKATKRAPGGRRW